MKRNIFIFFLLLSSWVSAQTYELPRTTPESEGIPSEAVLETFHALLDIPHTDIHSVMVLRHGKVVGEMYPAPFTAESAHTLYSCSKTFVGVAVGIAIQENRLRLTDRVLPFFPECAPADISDNLAAMTVQDLLRMTSGVPVDWNLRNRCTDWIRTWLSRVEQRPGDAFTYDSMCSYVLSAIVQKVTGKTLLDYLQEKVFTPLHITEVDWELSPEGYNTGGWGLRMQAESMAKFGLLLLHKGQWQGEQLIPTAWVDAMCARQVELGAEDYGYQLWHCTYPGALRADGAFGQYIIIVPSLDMVVVMTESTRTNGKEQRRIVWNRLLPQVSDAPLSPGRAYKKLQQLQADCRLPMPQGRARAAKQKSISAHDIVLSSNPYGWQQMALWFVGDGFTLHIRQQDGGEMILQPAYRTWHVDTTMTYPPYSIRAKGRYQGVQGPFTVGSSYAWHRGTELGLWMYYTNWMSALYVTADFSALPTVSFTVEENFSKEPVHFQGEMLEGAYLKITDHEGTD